MTYFTLLLLVAAALPGFSQTLRTELVANPSGKGSIQPNWSVAADGSAVLSWVEPSPDGALSLRYAVRRGTQWSEPHTVASKRHFFRHAAEVPEVMEIKPGTWMAHWIEQPNPSTDEEDVYVSSSTDGVKWTAAATAHQDHNPVEHGLASMAASGPDEVSLIWLEALHGEDNPTFLMRTIFERIRQGSSRRAIARGRVRLLPHYHRKNGQGIVDRLPGPYAGRHPRY